MNYYETKRARRNKQPGEYYAVRCRQRERQPMGYSLAAIFNNDAMYTLAKTLGRRSRTAGTEGVRFDQLTNSELGGLVRQVAVSVIDGSYRPGSKRCLAIPKRHGGQRTIHIANAADVLVARRLLDILTVVVDSRMSDRSWGFRPRSGTHKLLARLKVDIEAMRLWYLVNADVSQAFDYVPIGKCLARLRILAKGSPAHENNEHDFRVLLRLVKLVVTGGDRNRKVGIDQGCPLSPLLLNCLMNTDFDRSMVDYRTLWLRSIRPARYADNLLVAASSESECQRVLNRMMKSAEKSGLALKDQPSLFDLRSTSELPEVLGYRMQAVEGEVRFLPPANFEAILNENLEKAHDEENPAQSAANWAIGTIDSLGPVLCDDVEGEIVSQVRKALVTNDFREYAAPERLLVAANRASCRWKTTLLGVQDGAKEQSVEMR